MSVEKQNKNFINLLPCSNDDEIIFTIRSSAGDAFDFIPEIHINEETARKILKAISDFRECGYNRIFSFFNENTYHITRVQSKDLTTWNQ